MASAAQRFAFLQGGGPLNEKIIVVCGPTATGKTALGVALAQALDGEVVGADSMQVYRGMDIGTAKPTPAEMAGVPHHMIDVADPEEDFSAARYVDMALPIVEDILRRGKRPIVVGGTGLYQDNLLAGRQFAAFSGQRRRELEERRRTEGLAALYAELGRVDPQRQRELHPNDEKRILRALEVFYETGRTMTAYHAFTQTQPPRFQGVRIGLTFARREDLWARIDARVDEMMAAGLVEEVKALLDRGVPPGATSMQAIGYKELAAAIRAGGDVAAAAEEVKLRSRQYAKRQLSWFRRHRDTRWIAWEDRPDLSAALQISTDFLSQVGI